MSALTRSPGNILVQKFAKHPALLLGVLIVLIYIPSLFNGFVWDDNFVVVYNDFVKSGSNLKLVFTKQYLTKAADMSFAGVKDIGSGESSYRPMVTLSFFLDYAIWKLNPLGYHLHNLILHVFNSLFVFFLVIRLGLEKKTAFLTGLLFAWHPVQAEAVCGIANRDDLICMFYAMASFLLFMQTDLLKGNSRKVAYIFSLICLGLSMLSKEMALAFPVLFLLYDYFFMYRDRVKSWFQSRRYLYLGYGIIFLVYIVLRFTVLKIDDGPQGQYLGGSVFAHILSMAGIVATYLLWLIVPFGIHVIIAEDASFVIRSVFSSDAILSLGLVAAIFFLAFRLRQRFPAWAFGIFWFFITLIPVLNIIPLQNFMASRYLYIPSVGICLFLALLLAKGFELEGGGRLIKIAGHLLVGVILIGYGIITLSAASVWKDDLSFGRELARHYPKSARIRCILGTYYQAQGFLKQAKNEYDVTLQLDPKYGKGYLWRGIYYQMDGKEDQALSDLQTAESLDPRLWPTHFYLGNIYLKKGLYPEAIEAYHKLLTAAPRQTAAYNNLGVIYLKQGDAIKAGKMWEKTLEIDPGNTFALMRINELSKNSAQ